MVLQLPAPLLCARFGTPAFLGGILIAWGLVAGLFAWMRDAAQFYALRFILGLAESGAYPGAHCSTSCM
jgi:MFS family permease